MELGLAKKMREQRVASYYVCGFEDTIPTSYQNRTDRSDMLG